MLPGDVYRRISIDPESLTKYPCARQNPLEGANLDIKTWSLNGNAIGVVADAWRRKTVVDDNATGSLAYLPCPLFWYLKQKNWTPVAFHRQIWGSGVDYNPNLGCIDTIDNGDFQTWMARFINEPFTTRFCPTCWDWESGPRKEAARNILALLYPNANDVALMIVAIKTSYQGVSSTNIRPPHASGRYQNHRGKTC